MRVRTSALFIALMIVAPLFMANSVAAAGTLVYIDPPVIVGYTVGDSFNVTVRIDSFYGLYAWTFDITWDPAVLEYVSASEGDCLRSNGTTLFLIGAVTPGKIDGMMCTLLGDPSIYYVDVPPAPDDFVSMEFHVLECAFDSPIEITYCKLKDRFADDHFPDVQGSEFTCGCPVTFLTDPAGPEFSITFAGQVYTDGQNDTFPYGTSDLATASAAECWTFDHWEAAGNVTVSNSTRNPTTVTITCGGTLKAVFVPETFWLTITVNGTGSTSPVPDVYNYSCCTNVTVTAIETDLCWGFDHWLLDGFNAGSANRITVHMDRDHNLTAVFTQRTFWLTITFEGKGTTDPSPGVYNYSCCENVTIAAIKIDPCWQFSHWLVDGVENGSENPITIHMDMHHTLTAVFVRQTFWLTIEVADGCTTEPPPGEYEFLCCENVTITALPGPCWLFSHWVIDGVPDGSENPITIHMDTNHTIAAVFIQRTFWLTITVNGTGTTNPAPSTYEHFCCCNVTVKAIETDPSWKFSCWILDGVNAGTNSTIAVHMDMNHTLTAIFQKTCWLTITFEGKGTTDPSPGVYNYSCCENVTVKALPDPSWLFSHWLLDGVEAGSANPITVHMDRNHTLTAVFTFRYTPISIYTDRYSYSTCNTMRLGLNVTNPLDRAITVCIAIWLECPDDTIALLLHAHAVTLPASFTYSNPTFRTFVLRGVQPGNYTWHAAFLNPTTHKIICEDTAEWQYRGPAFTKAKIASDSQQSQVVSGVAKCLTGAILGLFGCFAAFEYAPALRPYLSRRKRW